MPTKKKATKKSGAAALRLTSLTGLDFERLLQQHCERLEEMHAKQLRVFERMVMVDRMCWVTIEGTIVEREMVPTDPLLAMAARIYPETVKQSSVPIVRRTAWTKAALMRHEDARVTVRFEPYGRMMVKSVRVYGAGALTEVRIGREAIIPGVDYKGLSLVDIDRVCELGSVVQVDLGPVLP